MKSIISGCQNRKIFSFNLRDVKMQYIEIKEHYRNYIFRQVRNILLFNNILWLKNAYFVTGLIYKTTFNHFIYCLKNPKKFYSEYKSINIPLLDLWHIRL